MVTRPRILDAYAPSSVYTQYPSRPVRGRVLHHTAAPQASATPQPRLGANWHRIFLPEGTVLNVVPLMHAAHHDALCDRWRPSWVQRVPYPYFVSDINYCSIGYEIQYAPQAPYNEVPTPEQYAALRYVFALDDRQFGPLPTVGHGEVASDKLLCEPCNFDWTEAGFGPRDPQLGRFWAPTPSQTTDEDMLNPTPTETIKGWLESAGQPVNMDTAIMKFAADAFQQGPPPHGNWRGPALPPGEYQATTRDGRTVVRHRFTAGVVEYDPATGGLGWVEVVAHPEEGQP